MSSASVTTLQQHAGNGYGALVGNSAPVAVPQPTSQQQQQNNGTLKNQSTLGYDTITPSDQVLVAQPLLHHADFNAARADTIDSSQIHAKYVDAMFTAAVVAVMFLAVPVTREIFNTRAKLRYEMFAEQGVQHTIRGLHQSQQDKSMDWVDNHEKLAVKQRYVDAVTADMNSTWVALHSSKTNLRQRAEDRIAVNGMPVVRKMENNEPVLDKNGLPIWVLKGSQETGSFQPSLPDTSMPWVNTGLHMHGVIETLQEVGKADGDLARIMHEQVGHRIRIVAKIQTEADQDNLIKSREARFSDKFKNIHNAAQTKFATEIFPDKSVLKAHLPEYIVRGM